MSIIHLEFLPSCARVENFNGVSKSGHNRRLVLVHVEGVTLVDCVDRVLSLPRSNVPKAHRTVKA